MCRPRLRTAVADTSALVILAVPRADADYDAETTPDPLQYILTSCDVPLPPEVVADVLGEDFWARHTNPWSGYTRLLMGPILLLGLYRRDWRMVGLTLLYVVINPILFPEPESKDAWVSRSVLGGQLWLEEAHEVFEPNLPGVLNTLNAVAYCYGLYGAYKRNPRATALGGGIVLTCKLVYLAILVRYYNEHPPVED